MITKGKAFDILDELLRRNFPEIKKRNLKLAFVKKQDYYMVVSWCITHFRIAIDNEIRKFSDVAFAGCLAYELAHVCDLQESNIPRRAVRLFVFSESEEKEKGALIRKL